MLLVGGVACNSHLRKAFKQTFEGESHTSSDRDPIQVYFPSPIFTTDNGAMIAAAGTPKLHNATGLDLELNASADLPLC
jgi:N6-L-threonylcarbamoyladenine synthase